MKLKGILLSDVAKVFNGKTPSKGEKRNNGYPVLKIKDIDERGKFKGTFDSFVDSKLAHKFSGKILKKNDILILNAAHSADYVGSKICIVDEQTENSLATGEWLIIRSNVEKVNPLYLYYWLRNDVSRYIISQLVKGIHLYPKDIAFIKINLPPLLEQKRMAFIFDLTDDLRRKRRQAIEMLDELLRAIFLYMFGDPVKNPKGWEINRLEDILDYVTSGSRGWAKYYSDSGSIFLRIQNVGRNQLLLNDICFVKAPNDAESYRTKVKAGDVLLTITADIGRTAVIPEGLGEAYINQHLALLRLKKRINPVYISQYLCSSGGKNQYEKYTKGGVKAGLNFNDIKSLRIPLPPLELQNHFETIFKQVESIREKMQKSMEEMDNLFHSLMQRAFKGELELNEEAVDSLINRDTRQP